MQFDALTAGIENGGLRSKTSIEILACYIVANSSEKITAKNIVDALVEGKIANYFEITNAISKMIKRGNFTEDEEGYLHISDDCRYSVGIVENDLPITIREKAIELTAKTVRYEINKKENKTEISKEGNRFKITMHVSDRDADFMELSLYVPTQAQAETIRDKFSEKPAEIYQNLINSIFE